MIGLREIQDTPLADRKAVKYFGPTVIQVKSLKHTHSNASIQIEALDSMLKNEEMCKTSEGLTKPILILSRDGHDGPRFPTTRDTLGKIFKEHDLDFIYCVCNAAGLSAYHFIERRMAPLSAHLAGVVLPRDAYGTHLDKNGNTIDDELEIQNFEKAGELLCALWNDMMIDNYPVKCTYRVPSKEPLKIDPITAEWVENHCRISTYCLQISKCEDLNCCKKARCNLKTIIMEKYLPGPLLVKRCKESGLQLASIGEEPLKDKRIYTSIMETMALAHLKPKGYDNVELPYDLFCPSVQKRITNSGGERYQCVYSGCKKIFTTLCISR